MLYTSSLCPKRGIGRQVLFPEANCSSYYSWYMYETNELTVHSLRSSIIAQRVASCCAV